MKYLPLQWRITTYLRVFKRGNVGELLKEIDELKFALIKVFARIEVLEKENAELRARLAMNSSNGSYPIVK